MDSSIVYGSTPERPQDLVDDVLVACLGSSGRRIDEVPAVDAFVKLISLQESLLDINFVQLSFAMARDIIRRATARPGVGEKLST